MLNFWTDCSRLLERELTPQQFSAWIKPLRALDYDASTGRLRIGAPNRWKLDAIRAQFAARIQAAATNVLQRPVDLIFEVEAANATTAAATATTADNAAKAAAHPNEIGMDNAAANDTRASSDPAGSPASNPASSPTSRPTSSLAAYNGSGHAGAGSSMRSLAGAGLAANSANGTHGGAHAGNYPGSHAGSHAGTHAGTHATSHANSHAGSHGRTIAPEQLERARLNSVLTFDNFVTGKANQLARAAAMQVSENPGGSYNPLFLYGGVGLGKTHLVHAVGNGICARRGQAKVRYIHAEQYVSDVVRAYQRKAFDEFKHYYHSLDLLLIDDIQFFAGKSRTQEEFFYAFEALVAGRKQIIITCDTYPKELKDIEDRLVSRFTSGLTVAIEPPELEMRVAILLKKAELEQSDLPEEVAFFIAKNLRSNVRELEGALRKILAFASFHARPITVDLAREALRDLLGASVGQITVELIQKTVADYYKIKVADMYSKRRPNNIALPRQVAMYLAKELTQKSLPEIGELFGGRDHTTVLHAVRKISAARGSPSELNHALHVLEQSLRG